MHRASWVVGAMVLGAAIAGAHDARAQGAPPRPQSTLTAAELGRTPPPPHGTPRRVVEELARLSDVQRLAMRPLLNVPPEVTHDAARDWLPDVRAGTAPAGELPIARPRPELDVVPMQVQTVNTRVAVAQGNDGMLMGASFVLPWRVP